VPDPAWLRWHIERDTARHGGALPVASALAWFGYIEALRQWRLLDFDDYEALLVLLPGIPEQWDIWSELQLWRFDADIAYGGLAFNQEEDWDHQTQTYKQSALTPERIEMRTKENIGDLAGRVLLEIQGTIMSQLLQADLKAWDEQ
jgi:hypothetical protein